VKFRNAFFLMLALVFLMSSSAFAQNDDVNDDMDDDMDDDADDDADDDVDDDVDDDMDDDADDDSDEFSAAVDFDAPLVLEADETYDFEFTVKNTTSPGEMQRWINKLEMFMPDPEYAVDEDYVSSPDAIHDGDWTNTMIEHETEEGDVYMGIRWQYSGYVTSEDYGDIREEDAKYFAKAGEDDGDIAEGEGLGGFAFRATTDPGGTDGFDWAVWADDGTLFIGESCVVVENCEEVADDDDVDDDTDDEDRGDDDDDSAGGCGC
jgi:hypothetical protein